MLVAFRVVKDRHTLAARAFDFELAAQVVALREQLVTDSTAVLRRVFVHNGSFDKIPPPSKVAALTCRTVLRVGARCVSARRASLSFLIDSHVKGGFPITIAVALHRGRLFFVRYLCPMTL